MEFVRLPAEEAAVRRVVEELWLPYDRELEAVVEAFALDDGVDFVDEELPYRLDRLREASYRVAVAADGADLAAPDTDLAGFVATEVDECPSVFDRPDRLTICDIYVREPYRGGGLAGRLIDRAREHAREQDCPELSLDVDVDNERALAFYERLGFEPARHEMRAPVER